ncbi:hypothetical protein BJ170DRAFT_626423 [Xylariales sp. AK1849]|nr:hypothetical protein BJ170DRAFT_626423 [Xylariales sp. AK1849]
MAILAYYALVLYLEVIQTLPFSLNGVYLPRTQGSMKQEQPPRSFVDCAGGSAYCGCRRADQLCVAPCTQCSSH